MSRTTGVVVSSEVPPALREHAALVDAALLDAVSPALDRLVQLDPLLETWARELRGVLVSGGKRLRPALVLVGHAAVRPSAGNAPDAVDAPDADRQAVVPAALAVELLHTCALLHDDLIDGSATRRGRATSHAAFTARHEQEQLAGEGWRYGAAAAVLLGDLAFVLADELFLRCRVPAEALVAGLRLFTRLREEVMAGQALDVEAAATRASTRELALSIAAAKSGRYSVARPLQLGALLGGAEPPLAQRLADAVEPLGQAFQVRDDLLGVFGDQDVTGKSAASDLREGKRTLLVVEALHRLGPAGRAALEEALGDPELDDAGVVRARELLAGSGAVEAVHAWLDRAVAHGMAAVEELPLEPEALEDLAAVGRWLVGRSA